MADAAPMKVGSVERASTLLKPSWGSHLTAKWPTVSTSWASAVVGSLSAGRGLSSTEAAATDLGGLMSGRLQVEGQAGLGEETGEYVGAVLQDSL